MPVQTENSSIQYTGNNSTVDTYTVDFPFLAATDLVVVVTNAQGVESAPLTHPSQYTVTGAGEEGGGTVRTTSPIPPSSTVTIFREPQATQVIEFQGTGRLPASTLTDGLDRLTMLVQSLLRKMRRVVRFSDSSQEVTAIASSARASTLLGFASDGNATLYHRDALRSLVALDGSLTGTPAAFWADNGARALKKPDFNGQLGLQMDESSLWRSTGDTPGQWSLLALDEDTLTSNSDRHPPTQQSVKAYVEATSASAASLFTTAYLPPGCIVPYAGTAAPTGWLLCYGQTVSRTTYAALFTAIGTTYGAGDGTTTFHLPDLRGRAVFGKDDMGGSAASRITNTGTGHPGINGTTLGAVGGVDRHTLTAAQIPAHRHFVVANVSLPNHSAGVTSSNQMVNIVNVAHDLGYMLAGTDTAATIGQSSSVGSGESHAQLPPTIVLNYLIRS